MIYLLWGLPVVVAAAIAVALVAMARRRAAQDQSTAEHRRRYALRDSAQRIPLAPDKPSVSPGALQIEEIRPPAAPEPRSSQPPQPARGVTGRIVNTPDGEMILTSPPFSLRQSIFNHRFGRFINALSRRIPAWVMICPRVRLDTLITPTAPDGRDPADWREWRKRVRLRSLDVVLCDRRTWRPIVAVIFDRRPIDAHAVAGGRDRMTDEVLAHVGLPLLHLTGDLVNDWPLVRPYVEESILKHISDEEALEHDLRPQAIDPEATAALLRIEED